MWCPRCRQSYDPTETRCPACRLPLVEQVVTVRLPRPAAREMPRETEGGECARPAQDPERRRAMRLGRQTALRPVEEAELETVMEEYMALYGLESEAEYPDEPVSPEGYRMVWGFLAVFGLLAAAAVVAALVP